MLSLQADNVQTILENTQKVAKVRDSLNDALALLDDVSENLATFDTKLQVMREDIAAIEVRIIETRWLRTASSALWSSWQMLCKHVADMATSAPS